MTKIAFKSITEMEQYIRDAALIQDVIFRGISEYLRSQRHKLQLSVHQVSIDTGIPDGIIDNVERGSKNMRWAAVAKLLRYYNSWLELNFIPLPAYMKEK